MPKLKVEPAWDLSGKFGNKRNNPLLGRGRTDRHMTHRAGRRVGFPAIEIIRRSLNAVPD